jgi:hypothetical protein
MWNCSNVFISGFFFFLSFFLSFQCVVCTLFLVCCCRCVVCLGCVVRIWSWVCLSLLISMYIFPLEDGHTTETCSGY